MYLQRYAAGVRQITEIEGVSNCLHPRKDFPLTYNRADVCPRYFHHQLIRVLSNTTYPNICDGSICWGQRIKNDHGILKWWRRRLEAIFIFSAHYENNTSAVKFTCHKCMVQQNFASTLLKLHAAKCPTVNCAKTRMETWDGFFERVVRESLHLLCGDGWRGPNSHHYCAT